MAEWKIWRREGGMDMLHGQHREVRYAVPKQIQPDDVENGVLGPDTLVSVTGRGVAVRCASSRGARVVSWLSVVSSVEEDQMRTRPLPNRHAHDLSLFCETIQATLNRNKAKGDLSEMSFEELSTKLSEEFFELDEELISAEWECLQGRTLNASRLEREAADVAVCALAAFIKARNPSRSEAVEKGAE